MVGYCAFTWFSLGLLALLAPLGAWLIGKYYRAQIEKLHSAMELDTAQARQDMLMQLQTWERGMEERERNLGNK